MRYRIEVRLYARQAGSDLIQWHGQTVHQTARKADAMTYAASADIQETFPPDRYKPMMPEGSEHNGEILIHHNYGRGETTILRRRAD